MKRLTRTQDYIKRTETKERKGHHVYVTEQMTLNSQTYLDDMTAKQIEDLDTKILEKLHYLDGFELNYPVITD